MIWGWVVDETMEDEARVTVIATGFEQSRQMLQPQSIDSRLSSLVGARAVGGSMSKPVSRNLASGIGPDRLFEDYDIPTFAKNAD